MDSNDCLTQADAIHDDDPARAATLLRQIDGAALAAERQPLLAFLLNHVLGEKLGDWADASARSGTLLAQAGTPTPALWRHAAVAARMAGDGAAAAVRTQALAAASGVPAALAAELVALAGAVLQAGTLPAAPAAMLALDALAPLAAPHWQSDSALDVAAAAQCNNLASGFVDRPLADLADPALRAALSLAAETASRLWQRAGTWVNHERASYLRALVSSALGDADAALAHANAGLALLDAHDQTQEQSVDRAFLTLEASFALERLGRADDALASRARADALAAAFGDVGLDAWFAERVARNAALRGAG
jgi:hypothetical protein